MSRGGLTRVRPLGFLDFPPAGDDVCCCVPVFFLFDGAACVFFANDSQLADSGNAKPSTLTRGGFTGTLRTGGESACQSNLSDFTLGARRRAVCQPVGNISTPGKSVSAPATRVTSGLIHESTSGRSWALCAALRRDNDPDVV